MTRTSAPYAAIAIALFASAEASAATHTATLTAPAGWRRQDFGGKFAPGIVSIWNGSPQQGTDFTPKIFLMQEPAQSTSLRESVRDALASFTATGYRIRVERPQRVCNGDRPGWLIVYTKQGDQRLTVEQTRFIDDATLYTATYVRLSSEPEDPDARKALSTLCTK